MEPSVVDEIDCGNLFDQIDDLIEFPPESECGGGGVGNFDSGGDCNDYPSMWSDALPEPDPFFSKASDISAELSVPYEDIVQLEWLSNFLEDSFSGEGMTIGKESSCIKDSSHNQFQPSSPVSGLESSSSSSSCSGGKTSMSLSSSHRSAQRARSKRHRPPTFNPRVAIQLISPSPEAPPLLKKAPRPAGAEHKKIKKIKITREDSCEEIRKCMHCEITKTPQWRAGPMGPKSLCNACGVRYKSSRLFPEYRPAASPTFVPSLHSNSHKKVVEMRIKATAAPTITVPEHTPNP